MKEKNKVILNALYVLFGAVLIGLGIAEILDEFWSGMGGGLIGVGAIRLAQLYRIGKDENYRERFETEVKDERNQFIRNKAWTWAGYLFVIICSIATLILRLCGQDQLSMVTAYAVCLLMILYWVSYMLLKKKY